MGIRLRPCTISSAPPQVYGRTARTMHDIECTPPNGLFFVLTFLGASCRFGLLVVVVCAARPANRGIAPSCTYGQKSVPDRRILQRPCYRDNRVTATDSRPSRMHAPRPSFYPPPFSQVAGISPLCTMWVYTKYSVETSSNNVAHHITVYNRRIENIQHGLLRGIMVNRTYGIHKNLSI